MANHRRVFLLILLILFPFGWSANTLSANEVMAISSNSTILSPGNMFELGFFKLTAAKTEVEDGDRWYLGIWFHKARSKRERCVWVANRERPLYNSKGALKIFDSNLVLLNESGTIIWSSDVVVTSPSPSPVVAELLANGNFVLRYSDNHGDSFLWESFNFPTDTQLPEMKLGFDSTKGIHRSLTSWKSINDPTVGQYSYKMMDNYQGLPEFFLLNGTSPIYRTSLGDIRLKTFSEKKMGYMQLLKVTYSGSLDQFSWSPTTHEPTVSWSKPSDLCDQYPLMCGSNSVCGFENDDMPMFPSCTCFNGFKPRNRLAWWFRVTKDGCKRKNRLSCDGNGFQPLENVKLPDTKKVIVERSIGFKECKQRCLEYCNCTGFAHLDMGITGLDCLMYTSELVDIRKEQSGHKFYVKVADTDIGEGTRISGKIIGLIISGGIIVLILTLAIFGWCWKRIQKPTRAIARNTDLLMDGDRTDLFGADEAVVRGVPRMEYRTILEATNDFCYSNKLGQGGFGTVYKGRLIDGNEIAVKKLTKLSDSAASQFLNELTLISRLQHINLIRLLGYCIHGEEHILVLEYLENRSLDFYLFGSTESSMLTWPIRFDIIHGIARGLMYLHQDSYFRIIHRDLKASNILLDPDMNPKITDFGMAQLIGRDETQINTTIIVGTMGYIAPEYMMHNLFSDKSDVYSFGVVLLELLSGKRNWGFLNSNGDTSLVNCVWRNWEEESLLEIVDSCIMDSFSSPSAMFQIVRSFQIGLLCVQEHAEDRPKMSSVVVMLESAIEIPRPKPPGHCDHYPTISPSETGSTSTRPPANEYYSVMEGR